VDSLAERLAARLGLPYRRVLEKARHTEQQKTRENSAQQAANVRGAFAVSGTPSAGPVLLIDDVVDSRWTLTECARVLREAGVGAVFPVALAQAGPSWKDTG
jgi:ATP-dependent DNA helicase RecQ